MQVNSTATRTVCSLFRSLERLPFTMRTAFIATALAATLGVTSAVLPTPWLGTWNGTIGVTYGQADPTAPEYVKAHTPTCFFFRICSSSM
ncbi:hypothetical protein EON66_01810 [archaeon]|nr:MAG: hypothetical protein EON66_01810 [archaeon]